MDPRRTPPGAHPVSPARRGRSTPVDQLPVLPDEPWPEQYRWLEEWAAKAWDLGWSDISEQIGPDLLRSIGSSPDAMVKLLREIYIAGWCEGRGHGVVSPCP